MKDNMSEYCALYIAQPKELTDVKFIQYLAIS